MSLSADLVVAASIAMTWVPETATTEETDEYRLVRLPDYFDLPLRLLRFSPAGPVEAALAAVLDRAREFGLPELQWTVRPDSPPVGGLLDARGAIVTETLDVLALDLRQGDMRDRQDDALKFALSLGLLDAFTILHAHHVEVIGSVR